MTPSNEDFIDKINEKKDMIASLAQQMNDNPSVRNFIENSDRRAKIHALESDLANLIEAQKYFYGE